MNTQRLNNSLHSYRLFLIRITIIALFLLGTKINVIAQITQNITVCPNAATINVGQNAGFANGGLWSFPSNPSFSRTNFGDSTQKTTTVINLNLGLNVLTYFDGGTTLTSNVTNYKVFAGPNQTNCSAAASSTIQLAGSDPSGFGTGLWTLTAGNPANVQIVDPTLYNTSVNFTQPGTYTFQWKISFSPSIVCSGTYTEGTASVNITVSGPTINVAGAPASAVCPATSVTLTASGAVSYLWDNGAITAARTISPNSTTTYTVIGTDAAGCKATKQTTITVNTLFSLTSSAVGYCAGGTGVTLTLSGSETGVNYQLKKGGVNDGAAVAGNGSTITWNNKLFGTYTVTATNTTTGCTMTMGNVTITENPLPTVSAGADVNGCIGSSYILTATGANTYVWNTSETSSSIIVSPAATTSYSVTGTVTASGCSASDAVTVTVFQPPTKYNVTGTGPYCQGTGGLTVNLTGSEAVGVTYQLLKNGIAEDAPKPGTGAALSWPNKTAATYTVSAQNINCSILMNGSAVLDEVALPAVYTLSGSSAYCADVNGVTLTLSGSQIGVNYTLNKGGFPLSTLSGTGAALTWPNSTNGTYTVDASTVNPITCGIAMTGTVSVAVNALPIVNAGADENICAGQSVQLNATGGVTYSWLPIAGLNSSNIGNPVASPASSTTYTVTATDVNGCTATDQMEVAVKPAPVVVITPNTAICYGQSTIINATDNIPGNNETYLWTTGSTNTSITVSPMVITTYSVTVTDLNNCSTTASSTISVNQAPGVNAGSDLEICSGTSKTLTGIGTADTWLWSTGEATTSITVSPAATTDYILRGSFAATGCYTDDIVKVTVNNLPAVSFTLNGVMNTKFCTNGALVALGGIPAGGTFSSTAAGAISGNTFNPVTAGLGTFDITYNYTDAKGCSNSNIVSVDVSAPPVVSITGLNASFCNTEAPFTLTGNPLQDGNGNYGSWTFSGSVAAFTDNANGTCTINPALVTIAGNYSVSYQEVRA
jgi:hypothetical protein